MTMRIKMLSGALVIATLVTLAIALGVATPNVYGGGDDTLPTLPEKSELKYPNLGSSLDQIVVSVEEGEVLAKEAAEDAPVHQEASVAVTIYLSGNLADVVSFLKDNGGSPRNVGEDYIEAYVPVTLLGQVSERPGVICAREIVPPEPAQSAQQIAGHGPPVHGSTAWNQAGFGGQGVKVGVIDAAFGFNDFRGLMGTEFPSSVQARCYTDVGRFTSNLSNCGNALVGSNHGTLLAEAVMDIAPEASLYIAAPWSLGDLRTATEWMVSQGVSVIVHGEIYEYDGPGDGTSRFSNSSLKTVDRAVSGGIVWVNAAGNQGQSTWFGNYSIVNVNGNKYVAFNGSDIFNDMTLEAWDWIRVQLRWEDSWSGANRDFDLLIWDFATSDFVDYSFDPQQGRVGQVPFESLSYLVPNDGRYAVVVAHEGGSTPEWIQLTAWGVDSIEYHTERGSITNPAESANPGMLAVGAAHWSNVHTIEPYSSQGPTPDGRVKPDIVGATCGATALRPLNESNEGFCGTSQSAPHIAGMAALVRQRFPTYTPVQVANYLKEHAEQRESPDPNNTWGHGFAKLPSLNECSDAVPSVASNPGLVADCEALLAARDPLAGSGTLNWSGSTAITAWDGVTLSGSPLRVTSLVLSESQLTGAIPPELGGLSNLTGLWLHRNQLTGEIPPELSLLTNLQLLALGGNQLTGVIPTELGILTNLEILELGGNQLTGPIPSELASLTNLRYFSLFDNQLSGPVPTWMGSLADLQELYLSQNQLTGTIPKELGAGASGAPTIGTLTPGADFLTITWAAPTGSPESAIIAYDLRYIETAARDKSDVNWTVVDNAWTAGSGALSYQIAGLANGTRYDVQVRVVSAAGDGPWSATAPGTPATWGAIRSFSPPSVAPAGEVVVMITASGYGRFGAVTETLPPGFSYVSSSLEDSGVTDVGREVRFILFGQTAFTYTVTAPSAEGTYSFSGVLRNSDREDVPVGGALTIAVAAGDPLIVRYDANGSGRIDKDELANAVFDYEINRTLEKPALADLVFSYEIGL